MNKHVDEPINAYIVFSDWKGFSQLSEGDYKKIVKYFLRRLSKELKVYVKNSKVWNTWGDGLIAVFSSGKQTVDFLFDYMKFFKNYDFQGISLPRLIPRIGCDYGEFILYYNEQTRKKDAMGKKINTAARIEPITASGEIFVTKQFRDAIENLPEEISYIEFEEKGILELAKKFGDQSLFRLRKKYEFQIKESSHYKRLVDNILSIKSLSKMEFISSSLLITRTQLHKEIEREVSSKGIAVIYGPQLIGKTMLVKSFVYADNSLELIDTSEHLSFIKNKITKFKQRGNSNIALYATWVNCICKTILEQRNVNKKKLSQDSQFLCDDIEWIDGRIKLDENKGKNRIESMLDLINNFLSEIQNSEIAVLAIHLDDLQNYLNETLFLSLRDDVLRFAFTAPTDYRRKKLKIIVSSRYFPFVPPRWFIYVPPLEYEEIKNILSETGEEWNELLLEDNTKKILEKTTGHVWFVVRLICLYLRTRERNDTTDPNSLIDKICENGEWWVNDEFLLSKNNESEFLKGYIGAKESIKVLQDYNIFWENTKKFLKEDLERILPRDLNREEYSKNPLLVQTGLLRFEVNGVRRTQAVEGITNPLVKSHFVEELRNLETLFSPKNPYGKRTR